MTSDLARRLAARLMPDPTPAFVAKLEANDALMALAATDMDAAAAIVTEEAVALVRAYVDLAVNPAARAA